MLRAATLVALVAYVSAQSLSSTCTSALSQIALNPAAASCLNPVALVSLVSGNSSTSIVPGVDNWLSGICSSPACSNETISAVVANVTAGCSTELGTTGLTTDDAASITTLVQQYYPTVRKVLCLKDGNTNCITETLDNIQGVLGTLSLTNIITLIVNPPSTLSANITCTNCVKAAYNVIVQDIPQITAEASVIQQQCGTSFTDGAAPSGISQSASTATAGSTSTDTTGSGALSSFVGVGWTLVGSDLELGGLCAGLGLKYPRFSIQHYTIMDPYRNPRRQSGVQIPKPENDLAEWASKIKAMQRQVDADEEAEQRRLEEEIAAARQARLRRSRGGRPTDSSDLSRVAEQLNIPSPSDDASSYDRPRDATERLGHQSEALRKIMGQNAVHVPETVGRSEAVSLASFMGGRAAGPRLNKHAAQPNAHDPTLYNQPDVSAPHPIFGRGGIAMPGMVSKKDLGGGVIKASESNQGAISDLKSVVSNASRTSSDVPRNAYLRQPDEERKKSTSPSPRMTSGSEAAGRYRPSASPTPGLRPQKSFDRSSNKSYGMEEAERYRPSPSPSPSSTLRPQKSFDRSNKSYGTEEAERYRPSTSPTPNSNLRPQKSFDRGSSRAPGSEEAERYRPSASPTPSSTLQTRKSFDRGNSRSYGTEDSERYRPSVSPTPSTTLRPQKSFDKTNNRRSYGDEDSERYRPSVSHTPKTLNAQKSFERNSGTYRGAETAEKSKSRPLPSPTPQAVPPIQQSFTKSSTERSVSPQKVENRFPPSNIAKPIPNLRNQKSWTRTDERPVSPQKTGGRERALSTPKPPRAEASQNSGQAAPNKLWTPSTPGSQVSSYLSPTQGKAAPSSRERTISTPSFLPKGPLASQPAVYSTASLARPIQPEPRIPASIPKVSSSAVPSPAFRKPAQSKDVTPSISRLQGRGFVQNMVQASLTLESAPSSTTSSPAPENPRPSNVRKGSVLDRWRPQNRQASPTSPISPVKSNFSTPIRRAATTEPQSTGRQLPTPITTPSHLPSYLKPTKSASPFPGEEPPLTPRTTARMMEKMAPNAGHLGSATTAFVAEVSGSSIDDFGVKRPSSRGPIHSNAGEKSAFNHHSRTSELPAPTGKPLIHPTKDRARRPKRGSAHPVARTEPTVSETKPVVEEPPLPIALKESPVEKTHSSLPDSKIGRLTEHWMSAGPITPKATSPPSQPQNNPKPKEPKQYGGIRRALPGMVKAEPRNLEAPVTKSITPKKSFERPTPVNIAGAQSFNDNRAPVPASPGPHVRIPSSGSRATVMEVAQALSEHAVAQDVSPTVVSPTQSPTSDRRTAVPEKEELRAGPVSRNTLVLPGASEKRKSSYDSFITLPPLREEATPAPSPANTFTRLDGRAVASLKPVSEHIQVPSEDKEKNKSVHDDPPLPVVDLSIMMTGPTKTPSPVPEDAKTISVDIMSIVGSNSTTLTKDENVFYDSEALAIIHRFKVVSSGLVDTYVWGWLGKRSQFGEPEEKKLYELARRYGTTPVIVRQYAEPEHLIRLLGGRLAVRQGVRSYWTVDNTAMHLVRAANNITFIDEHDLNVQNLCSAFSYCVSALGTVYVWYGTGSLAIEREAALQYAKSICGDFQVVELTQGENDDNEMFWMLLGEASFADADYWRWRKSSAPQDIQPSVWRVDSTKKTRTILPVEFFSDEANPCLSVYIVNCVWELFVVVGVDARGHRHCIRLALDIAQRYAQEISLQRPYTPNVHALILPSQFPLDLRLQIRDMDEGAMNLGAIPDHMNLVSLAEATEQLANTSWKPEHLRDPSMLPLGVDVPQLSV